MEWCIRQLCCSSIILCNNTSIVYKHELISTLFLKHINIYISQEELERGIEDIKTEIKGLEAQLSVEVETDTDTDTGKKKKKEKDVEGEESKEGEGSSFPAESASTLPALQEHSSQSQYTPSIVRRRLRSFIDWYISSGEMNYPSALHSASGMHYCAIGHPAFGTFLSRADVARMR